MTAGLMVAMIVVVIGAAFACLVLGVYVAACLGLAFLYDSAAPGSLRLEALLLPAAGFVAKLIPSALAGKLLGLTAAAVRYRRTCRELIERLQMLSSADVAHASGTPVGRVS